MARRTDNWTYGEILAMSDRQIHSVNLKTDRKAHPVEPPAGFVETDWRAEIKGAKDVHVRYAEYYAGFLMGIRVFPGQPSKFGLDPDAANTVREVVRTRLFDSAGITTVVPMDNNSMFERAVAIEQAWLNPSPKPKAAPRKKAASKPAAKAKKVTRKKAA